MSEYKMERHRIDKIPREAMIEELVRVAGIFNYVEFGKRDYDKVKRRIHSNVVRREFGG